MPPSHPSNRDPEERARMLRGYVRQCVWLLPVWALLGLLATSWSYSFRATLPDNKVGWWDIGRTQLAYYAIWALVITPLVVYLCGVFPLEKHNWRRRLPIHLLASLGGAALVAALRLALEPVLRPYWTPRGFSSYFLSNGYNDFWMYMMVVVVCHAWSYYERFRDREVAAAHLQARLASTQLQVLRTQLQPHFLFNTLHSISALMHRDVEAADRMMSRLSELLRATLETAGMQEVRLKDELEFLRGYVEIEQTRFQDRLVVEMNVDPETLDAGVPNLILQPLVENAIRHGIATKAQGGRVEVRARRSGGFLELIVRDDGPGIEEHRLTEAKSGLGLTNTRDRLLYLYGDEHGFEVRNLKPSGLEVRLRIPFHGMSAEDELAEVLTAGPDGRPIGNEAFP